MPELPSGTVTFLFTDIERSTESAAALGDERWAEVLETHRELLRSLFEDNGGVEVGTEGDSFFVAFARAGDAVKAASDGQKAIETYSWPGEARLRTRMGLHTGEALVRGGGYVGHDVHKAKRISNAGHGGQILLSQTTADLVREHVEVADLGPHRLKDLGEPQRIFQVIGQGLHRDFPPLRSLEAFRHTLPPQRKSFIGRENEIAQVRTLLATSQLVTIHGVGGCGKTRLAVQVGAEVLDEYPDGVFFADLSAISDPEAIPRVLAEAVGLPTSGLIGPVQVAPTDEVIVPYLSERKSLLILDNCEHLLDACAGLSDRILNQCPGVSILATSREALQVEGEHAWRLPSLSVPEDANTVGESEAVSLFVARAKAVRSGFELTPTDAQAVAEICRRLDGIPLAIEFAAARVTHLSPKQIAQKLDDRFRLLTGGRRQVQRQLTLQAALDWSYDLLEEPERILLRRLAVFPADFSLEAAEGICAGDGVDGSAVTDLLGSLVAKSLLGTEPLRDLLRFKLLETIRAYAADRLTIAGEAQLFRDRHRDWYLRWLEDRPWDESLGYGMIQQLIDEADNLRAAVEWSLSEDRFDLAARMVPRMLMMGQPTAPFDEMRAWSVKAGESGADVPTDVRAGLTLTSGFASQWSPEALDTIRHVAQTPETIPAAIRSLALAQLGISTGVIGAFARDAATIEESRSYLRAAMELADGLLPDFRSTVQVMNGMNELDLDNVPAAVAALEEAFKMHFELREGARESALLGVSYYLSAAFYAHGDYARAVEMIQYCKDAATSVRWQAAVLLVGPAAPIFAVADVDEARDFLRDTLPEVRRSNMPRAVDDWLSGAAGVLTQAGEYEVAARLLAFVRSRSFDIGLPASTPAQYVVDRHNVRIIRDALDRNVALRCREEGRSMSVENAIGLALEVLQLT